MSLLKKGYLATLGAFEFTKEKAEQVIDDLIAKGEIHADDRRKAVVEFWDQAEDVAKKMKDKVKKETVKVTEKAEGAFSKLASEFDFVKQDEYDSLKAKVEELQKRMDELGKK